MQTTITRLENINRSRINDGHQRKGEILRISFVKSSKSVLEWSWVWHQTPTLFRLFTWFTSSIIFPWNRNLHYTDGQYCHIKFQRNSRMPVIWQLCKKFLGQPVYTVKYWLCNLMPQVKSAWTANRSLVNISTVHLYGDGIHVFLTAINERTSKYVKTFIPPEWFHFFTVKRCRHVRERHSHDTTCCICTYTVALLV